MSTSSIPSVPGSPSLDIDHYAPPPTPERPAQPRYQLHSDSTESAFGLIWLAGIGFLLYLGHFLVIAFWLDWGHTQIKRFIGSRPRNRAALREEIRLSAQSGGDLARTSTHPTMLCFYAIDSVLAALIWRRRR